MEPDYWQERWDVVPERTNDARDVYERDLARIIHSPAFRRLQGKTQVLGVGENDFYRTRLTHSVEVAQIAASLVRHHYRHKEAPDDLKSVIPAASHITGISLFHDIGHPPFGHGGELALNRMMHDHGGFEGNAQTLRICAKLGHTYQKSGGLNLSRRTLLGLLKYPVPREQVYDSDYIARELRKHEMRPINELSYVDINYELWKPAKCFYDSEKEVVDWILKGLSSDEKSRFMETTAPEVRSGRPSHRQATHKSLDASIMDLSDDISYGIHDLEDAIHLELVKQEDWNEIVKRDFNALDAGEIKRYGLQDLGERLFNSNKKWEIKNAIGQMINYLINKSKIIRKDFSDPLLRYRIILPDPERAFLDAVKKLVNQKVIKSASVQTLEFRGLQIVTRLVDTLSRHPGRLLDEQARTSHDCATTESDRMRVISDHVSGMTDDFATKLYERLFVPRRGSLFEKI